MRLTPAQRTVATWAFALTVSALFWTIMVLCWAWGRQ